MAGKNKVMVFLFVCCAGMMVLPFIASCGKSGTVPASSLRIQMQVLNLSPDLQPVILYMGANKQAGYFAYPSPSGYFSLNSIDTPLRIKYYSNTASSVNILALDSVLKPNYKYTLFITGLHIDSTITSIFAIDTAATPAVGRGKIRFVNASPRSTAFDVTANGVMAFTNQTYKNVSKFIQVPPGTYDFKIQPKGLATVVSDFPNVTIADGKVYTLYCHGIAGGADSVAFSTGIISNK